MSTESLILMLVSMVVIWGGLAVTIASVMRRPENDHMPTGGDDTQVPDAPA